MLWWTQLSCHFRFGFHSYGLRGLVILSVGERLAAGKWSDISWAAVLSQGRVWIINSRVEPRFDWMQVKDIQKFESVPSSQSWGRERVWNQKQQLSFNKLCLFIKVLKLALSEFGNDNFVKRLFFDADIFSIQKLVNCPMYFSGPKYYLKHFLSSKIARHCGEKNPEVISKNRNSLKFLNFCLWSIWRLSSR